MIFKLEGKIPIEVGVTFVVDGVFYKTTKIISDREIEGEVIAIEDTVKKLEGITLYAWVGEDELGSGEIGIKQGVVPAGFIPLVAIDRNKLDQPYITDQLAKQQLTFGKKICLVRFKFEAIVREV